MSYDKLVTVKITQRNLIDMLVDRVKYWTENPIIIDLYDMMYTNLTEGDVFEGCELDINRIVDNDYNNYCNTIERDENEADYLRLLECYHECTNITTIEFNEICPTSIEAVDECNEIILYRY